MERVRPIDTLRFLATLIVVLFHLRAMKVASVDFGILNGIIENLGSGVTLFFMISAFSMSFTFSDTLSYRAFLRKRFIRLVPFFYFVLLTTILIKLFQIRENLDLFEILLNLTFLFNFFNDYQNSLVLAGWTLGLEVWFSVLFPLLVKIRLKSFSLLIFILIAFTVILVQRYPHNYLFNGKSFIYNLPAFLLGMYLYKLWIFPIPISRHFKFLLFPILICFGILAFHFDLDYFNYIFLCLFYFVVILIFLQHKITFVVAEFWSLRSYSLYLWHPLIIYAVFTLSADSFTSVMISLVILAIVSVFSEKYLERYLSGWVKRII